MQFLHYKLILKVLVLFQTLGGWGGYYSFRQKLDNELEK